MRASTDILDEIRAHGEATYPEECCGFLLGHPTEDTNVVVALHRAENQREENRERRFLITPADYLAASRRADDRGLEIVGFYHSHPDHPARPSQTDLEEATFPGFTYVIVSVREGRSQEMTAWSLASDRSSFIEEPIENTAAEKSAKPISTHE